jgi:hypothetical protein
MSYNPCEVSTDDPASPPLHFSDEKTEVPQWELASWHLTVPGLTDAQKRYLTPNDSVYFVKWQFVAM